MLFLDRQDVAALLPMTVCIAAIEQAFRAHAEGSLPSAPGVLSTQVPGGGFHVKTAALGPAPGYYAAKINANFPGNPDRNGLPTVQGVVGLFDAADGRPQALLVCGCGNQGRAHLRALLAMARVVTDLTGQAAHMGELQHALAAGMMGIGEVHAELGELISGRKPGRSSPEEIFVFDSTGTALQDVASAAAVYQRALATGRGRRLFLEGAAAGHD